MNLSVHRNVKPILFILFMMMAGAILHAPQFKKDLVGFHVWRQTQTQNTILSFAFEDGNIFKPRRNERGAGEGVFRMEFPLMQWLVSKPVRWGEERILITRISCFLLSLIGVAGFFFLIYWLTSRKILSGAGAFLLLFCPLFYYYSINPLPDLFALSCGIWGLAFIIRWYSRPHLLYWLSGLLMLMISSLSKLPFILYYILPGIFLLIGWFNHRKIPIIPVITMLLSLVPILLWYAWVIPTWDGNGIVSGILHMSPEQRSDYIYYIWFHLRTTLPELMTGLPAFFLFLAGLFAIFRKKVASHRRFYPWILTVIGIGGFILFELNMIGKVHDYYFLPLLPFVLLVCVIGINMIITHPRSRIRIIGFALLLLIPVYSYFRITPRWEKTGFNEDLLTFKKELRTAVPEDALVMAGNDPSHHIFLYYIDRKGWVFENDWLTEKELKEAIEQGCRFLFTDSPSIRQNPVFQSYFGTVVATFNTISIIDLVLPDGHSIKR